MRLVFIVLLALAAALQFGCSSEGEGSFEGGAAAYERKDYLTAMGLWRPVAAKGNAMAQYNLGLMYAQGQGTPQNDAEAVKWYRLAAAQGYARAQAKLGFMYGMGRGVSRDYVRASLWFNLAAVKGDADALKNREVIAKQMTPPQIAEAQKLARECQTRNFEGC